VQYTSNYNLKKPEGTDIVNIDDLNDNADILDQKLKEVENKADNAPPNSVNDAAIGSRTPDQSQAPASPGTGTLTQLVSWLANRIKAITGKTNWWDAPPTTLQAAKTHMDAAAPHSGHETPAGATAKAEAAAGAVQAELDAHKADYTQHPYYAGDTSSTGTGILQITLPVTYSSWSAVPIGACFSFKNIYNNQTIASGIKLALAGLAGEKPILKPNGNLFTTLTKDAIYTVRWNGVNFILQGEGASGNATASDLLSGKTATTDAGEITGTMPNRGAVSHSLAINGTYTIPAGYHNGSGQVTQSIPTKGAQTYTPTTTNQIIAAGQYLAGNQTIAGSANLVPGNIREGVNIFGVVGNYIGSVQIETGETKDAPKGQTKVITGLSFTPNLIIISCRSTDGERYYLAIHGTLKGHNFNPYQYWLDSKNGSTNYQHNISISGNSFSFYNAWGYDYYGIRWWAIRES